MDVNDEELKKILDNNNDEELKEILDNNQMKKMLFATIYRTILYNLDCDNELDELTRISIVGRIDLQVNTLISSQPLYTEIFRENILQIIEIKQKVRILSKDDLIEYIEAIFYLNVIADIMILVKKN